MPEEHNRVLSDHCADALFCPTETAVANLAREGITRGVHLVGDVMFDAVLHFGALARARSTVLGDLALEPREYHLATVHRAYNTDDAATLDRILRAVDAIGEPVIFPLHPRTRQRLNGRAGGHGALDLRNVRLIDPVGYLDMLMLEQHARSILTDSGGVQKEAYFFSVPCVTLRPETEWVETVSVGWNVLVGSDPDAVVNAARSARRHSAPHPDLFGDGNAGVRIARVLGGWRV